MNTSMCYCVGVCTDSVSEQKSSHKASRAYLTVILASCNEVAGTDRTPKNTSKLASASRSFLGCGSDSLTLNPEHFWQTQTQCLRNALSKDFKCLLISTAKSASGSSRLDP